MAGKKNPAKKNSAENRRRSRRRRRPDLLDELTVTGLSRATESHIQDLCYEALKDPDYQEEMLKRSEKFFALLSAGFRKKLKALRKARAAARSGSR